MDLEANEFQVAFSHLIKCSLKSPVLLWIIKKYTTKTIYQVWQKFHSNTISEPWNVTQSSLDDLTVGEINHLRHHFDKNNKSKIKFYHVLFQQNKNSKFLLSDRKWCLMMKINHHHKYLNSRSLSMNVKSEEEIWADIDVKKAALQLLNRIQDEYWNFMIYHENAIWYSRPVGVWSAS